ncbi:MAG: hypothetical protein V9G20_28980 [Candidatus Promineifilaceae bacterium]
MSTNLTYTGIDWSAKIAELVTLLEELRPQLLTAEESLADRLATINRFEFHLRSRIGHLTQQLESLEAEIADLRTLIRRRREEWLERNGYDAIVGEWGELWEVVDEAEGAEAGDTYRYRDPAQRTAPKTVTQDEAATLKKLYRQLARRFHPDLAENDSDRTHRTALMIAINAAYAAADLARLEQLALEPDSVSGIVHYHNLQQQAEALLKEITRVQNRLKEIHTELKHLAQHRSSRLMRRVDKATNEGRDLIAEIMSELKEKITQTLIERDVLTHELVSLDNLADDDAAFVSDALADAIWDMSLENAYMDEAFGLDEWLLKHRGRKAHWDDDENDLESYS